MNIQEALIKLSDIGIEAKLVDKSRIYGGKPSKTELGFSLYAQPFSLYFDKNIWILITTKRGQNDNEEKFNTLNEAIKKLYLYYA
ncbi:MAG: hypothetical protein AAFQ80_13955 [Cyanobacteria bacterium J06621_8]